MRKTTVCYIRNNNEYLMLYRNRKPNDPNEGKWLGIGGRIEDGETPDGCNLREVEEETGLRLLSFRFHGIIRFRSDTYEDEDMYLYSSDDFEPADEEARRVWREMKIYTPPECDEGELHWIPEEQLAGLPMWEGDKVFLSRLLEGRQRISMTLTYSKTDAGDICTVTEDETERDELTQDKSRQERLEQTFRLFIDNTAVLRDTGRWDGEELHRLGAILLTAQGVKADREGIGRCERALKSFCGTLSVFRGRLRIYTLCRMLMSKTPEELLRNADRAYRLLRLRYNSEYEMCGLAAFPLAAEAENEMQLLFLADRTEEIYSRLREIPELSTLPGLIAAAAEAAAGGMEPDGLIQSFRSCRRSLENSVPMQTADFLSLSLAAYGEYAPESCARLRDLYSACEANGLKTGGGGEASAMSGLALLDIPVSELAEYIIRTDAMLRREKGFGFFGCTSASRHMYAGLLVMNALIPENTGNEKSGAAAAVSVTDRAVSSGLRMINTL